MPPVMGVDFITLVAQLHVDSTNNLMRHAF